MLPALRTGLSAATGSDPLRHLGVRPGRVEESKAAAVSIGVHAQNFQVLIYSGIYIPKILLGVVLGALVCSLLLRYLAPHGWSDREHDHMTFERAYGLVIAYWHCYSNVFWTQLVVFHLVLEHPILLPLFQENASMSPARAHVPEAGYRSRSVFQTRCVYPEGPVLVPFWNSG